MCEARVYLEKGGKLEQIMENVVTVRPDGDQLILTDIFGEEKKIKGSLKEVKLLDHQIILEEGQS